MLPDDGDAVEGVDEGVVVGEAEGGGGGVQGAGEAEAAAGDGGGGGAQVELDGVVELVGVDAVDFGDVEVAVVGGRAEEAFEELEDGEPELRREDGVEDALAERQHPQKGSHRRPKLLHINLLKQRI